MSSINVVENGKRLRKLRGDTPARVVADAVGVSESALLMYERGERNPRDTTKCHLADYYGVGLYDIFLIENTTKREEANK